MKLVLLLLTAAGVAAVAFCDGGEESNARVKEMIIRSGTYIHGGERAARALMAAKEHCGSDTNRFANLLCDISQTNDMYIARRMVRLLGRYGTREQLPHLYSLVANTNVLGATAVDAVLQLEGVTSNSVALAGAYLSMTNVDFEYRAEVCAKLLNRSAMTNTPTSLLHFVRETALAYAMRANRYVRGVDTAMMANDPSYRVSRRRLAVLRSVHAMGVSQYQIAYVTNAINELVAYPEQNLPE